MDTYQVNKYFKIFRIVVYATIAVWLLFGVRSAYAVDIFDLLKYGPLDFVATFFVELLVSFIQNVLSPLCQVLFDWGTDFMTIPFVNTVILGLQGIAVIAVIIIRIGIGISSGLLLKGGDREQSLGEYIYKTIVAIIIVALMPMLCRLVIQFGNHLYNDITNQGGSIAETLAWFTVNDDFNIDTLSANTHPGSILWFVVGIVVICVLCIACGYQFVRRQIEMLTVSIIGPLVSIYAATENDDNMPIDLLKNLFGLVCLQWLQYLLVQIALWFGIAWISNAFNQDAFAQAFDAQNAQFFLFTLATFGAALTIPNLVDRYTFSGGGSAAGRVAVGALVSRAIPRGGGARGAAGKAASVVRGGKK